jgi:hypothetical protein
MSVNTKLNKCVHMHINMHEKMSNHMCVDNVYTHATCYMCVKKGSYVCKNLCKDEFSHVQTFD